MRTIFSSKSINITLSLASFTLLALSCNSVLFACPNSINQLHIIGQNTAVKINNSLSIQTTAEGDDFIETANGSIIN
ncbi:hypothetical protein [Legionella sp. km772]|uniref:hypothetical protein n=1 Tax=Legionella sp. km772 TaxID=2498111 RepID=UPI000F8F1B9B|nr:hypothetical protein [Legionella sp. km772]RUR11905.1 hypothetical protein ELY15_06720 [Legionella sp. km772]